MEEHATSSALHRAYCACPANITPQRSSIRMIQLWQAANLNPSTSLSRGNHFPFAFCSHLLDACSTIRPPNIVCDCWRVRSVLPRIVGIKFYGQDSDLCD